MGSKPRTPEKRAAAFWARVTKGDGCWIWEGAVNPVTGYGQMWDGERYTYVHRFAYRDQVGDIPAGLHIDHLCRTRLCVRPDHLEAVLNKENVMRGYGAPAMNARKTHCLNGHPLGAPDPNGHRKCAPCQKERLTAYEKVRPDRTEYMRAWRAKRKAAS